MFTRRNWLLRCSILINVAVILYIGSHVMIGGGNNFGTGPAFIIQEQEQSAAAAQVKLGKTDQQPSGWEPLLQKDRSPPASSDDKPPSASHLIGTDGNDTDEPPSPVDGGDGETKIVTSANVNGGQPKEISSPSIPETKKNSLNQPTEPVVGASGQLHETATFVNTSSPDGYIVSGDEKEFNERLRSLLKCNDNTYVPDIVQRGDFWVLKNYIRAEHGEIQCHETITYTTHADYTFLDNLIPLLERWLAPISIAMHAPGTDFTPTINSIKYLRDCLPEGNQVRQFVTFHIYFSSKHIPKNVPKHTEVLKKAFNCTLPPSFVNTSAGNLYKTQKKLLYPVNVGRNIARDAALTHFILASDIELYPNPGLVKKFLEMIARNEAYLRRKAPRVFPLSIFEVESTAPVPRDKTELQELVRTKQAIAFHKRVCAICHGVPKSKEWMAANETDELGVFHIGKRMGYYVHWEPIYIGTNGDPHYDERLSWEGKSDKMTQGYALCVLDYEFHILDNAFLVHKPGIKVLKKDQRRAMLASKTNQLIKKVIYPELRLLYGTRKGCAV